jgi:hypothetical protein
MNRTLTTVAVVLCAAGLAACSSNSTSSTDANAKPAATKTVATASAALTQITAKVPTAKLSGTVTAANDPDHLLGRPNQYTSKVTFSDSRIKASDVAGTAKGDVTRGGEIEVFADPASAAARAKYIETVTKSLPALAEYDYVHGAVLVRVSMLLTPAQAGEYKTAANGLG